MPSNHLILRCPLLLLPSIFLTIRVFSNESALCIRWPKYWSCSFNISPSNEHSGLISFRMDWLALLAVQGTLKSLLQHHTQSCPTLCDPMDYSLPGSSVHEGFLRQEFWSGLPFPSPEDLPNPGIEPGSPALQADSLLSEPRGNSLGMGQT